MVLPNMKASEWLVPLVAGVWNREESKSASKSAARRWISNGSVKVNGESVSLDELINFPVFSIIVFPKSNRRVTLL
jgi:hypothetical protein